MGASSNSIHRKMWPCITDLWKTQPDAWLKCAFDSFSWYSYLLVCLRCQRWALLAFSPPLSYIHWLSSKLNFRGSHNMVYFYLNCDFFENFCQSGCIFNHMSNSGISFVSWGGKTPRVGVNRLRGEVQFLLSTFDIAVLRWLTLCLWSHPTWFEGNTLLFSPSPVIRAVTRSPDAWIPQGT